MARSVNPDDLENALIFTSTLQLPTSFEGYFRNYICTVGIFRDLLCAYRIIGYHILNYPDDADPLGSTRDLQQRRPTTLPSFSSKPEALSVDLRVQSGLRIKQRITVLSMRQHRGGQFTRVFR